MSLEKIASYQAKNTYHTLNKLTDKTQNIWIVFHGMGYLSRYFIRYFRTLDAKTNYIIAPQAPSKYYQDSTFKHVGASWLTRENRELETDNVLAFVQSVWENEIQSAPSCRVFVLGYSQGVSIATRWVAKYKIDCQHLILHSGGIPEELKKKDFDHLNKDSQTLYLYGDKDPYITEARKTEEQIKGNKLFDNLKIEVFEGKHEVYPAIFPSLTKL
ncbi:MAG TPA: hypothetical protein VKX30_06060 [Flavobacteriaceae bacterium]|nr:hypothetical protein [Flavobacteriaceae bacterium]